MVVHKEVFGGCEQKKSSGRIFGNLPLKLDSVRLLRFFGLGHFYAESNHGVQLQLGDGGMRFGGDYRRVNKDTKSDI